MTTERAIATVAVVGAGVIGRGVAQNLAASGHETLLLDVSADVLTSALAQIRRDLRFARFHSTPVEDDAAVLARIRATTEIDALADADFVVENVVEDSDVKEQLYARLDEVCRADVVFAANTSCIPVTRLAARTSRPDRVLGIHFMNPVPLTTTVEMIRGWQTSDETLDRARSLLTAMGKSAVLVQDSPGFVSNRVLMLAVNEAAYLVQERVADPAAIDEIFRNCFGHKMGMLETADLIGIDTVLRSIEILHEEFGDSKYRPCPLLRRMVEAGHLGRKSGQGFHTYRRS